MHVRFLERVVPFLLPFLVALEVHAECFDTDKARTAYDLGERALQARNVELAVSNFQEANRLCPNPSTQLAISTAYLLGQRASLAREALNRYVAEAGASADWCSVIDMRRQLTLLDGNSEHQLTINVLPRSARVFIREAASVQAGGLPGCQIRPTEERLTIKLPAGSYAVTAVMEQQAPRAVLVDLAKPTTVDISFPLVSLPPQPTAATTSREGVPETTRPESFKATAWYERPENWLWIGAGVIGVTSSALGIWALSLESDLDQACGAQRRCSEAAWSDVDKHDRLATISTAGFVVAAVGAAAGAGVYLWRRHNDEPSKVGVTGYSLGSGQVTLHGRF